MIAVTYAGSGILLAITGVLFVAGELDAITQALAWSAVFFVASAAASSAYLTVSELFPVELRARAIGVFYAFGTLVGAGAPVLFGALIDAGDPRQLFAGYLLASVLMVVAATRRVAARCRCGAPVAREPARSLSAITALDERQPRQPRGLAISQRLLDAAHRFPDREGVVRARAARSDSADLDDRVELAAAPLERDGPRVIADHHLSFESCRAIRRERGELGHLMVAHLGRDQLHSTLQHPTFIHHHDGAAREQVECRRQPPGTARRDPTVVVANETAACPCAR